MEYCVRRPPLLLMILMMMMLLRAVCAKTQIFEPDNIKVIDDPATVIGLPFPEVYYPLDIIHEGKPEYGPFSDCTATSWVRWAPGPTDYPCESAELAGQQLHISTNSRFIFKKEISFFAYVKDFYGRIMSFEGIANPNKPEQRIPGFALRLKDKNTILFSYHTESIVINHPVDSGWNHIGFTYGGTTLRVYINGSEPVYSSNIDIGVEGNSNYPRIIFGEHYGSSVPLVPERMACIAFGTKAYDKVQIENLMSMCGTPQDSAIYAYYPLNSNFKGAELFKRHNEMQFENVDFGEGVTGKAGESVHFSGDSYLELVNDDFKLETMSFFIYVHVDADGPMLSYQTHTNLEGIKLERQGIIFSISNRRVTFALPQNPFVLEAAIDGNSTWNHIGFTYDADDDETIRIWVNGGIAASDSESWMLATAYPYIYCGDELTGNLACAAFHTHAMEAKEIESLMLRCGTRMGLGTTPEVEKCDLINPDDCRCSQDTCGDGFAECSLQSCGECMWQHCCCAQEPQITIAPPPPAPCADPANCHCYVDNCFDVGFDYCVQGTCALDDCDAEHCCCCEKKIDEGACLDKPCHCIDEGRQCSDDGLEYCHSSRCHGLCDGLSCCCQKEQVCPAWSECHCMTQPCSAVDELHDCDRCCSDCPFGHCCCCDKEWDVCSDNQSCQCQDRACDELPGFGFCDPSRCHISPFMIQNDIWSESLRNFLCPSDQCCCKISTGIDCPNGEEPYESPAGVMFICNDGLCPEGYGCVTPDDGFGPPRCCP